MHEGREKVKSSDGKFVVRLWIVWKDLNLKVAELFRDEFFLDLSLILFVLIGILRARGKKKGMDLVKSLEQVL